MNIIEQQTTSMIVRLLQSNFLFHNGKNDIYEEKAQDYIEKACT